MHSVYFLKKNIRIKEYIYWLKSIDKIEKKLLSCMYASDVTYVIRYVYILSILFWRICHSGVISHQKRCHDVDLNRNCYYE